MDVSTVPCSTFVGAVRHHHHFLEDEGARARLESFCSRIVEKGMKAFLDEEYPPGSGKAFIVNEVAGRLCLVDGNAHMVAIVRCLPDVTLADLVQTAGRDDFVRIWRGGWEEGSGQTSPYEVYLPVATNTSRVPGCYEGVDGFKNPPAPTKIMPAGIAFDSPLFDPVDRGRPLGETARCLNELRD